MKKQKKAIIASYVRNFVFGVEDSLVSSVGLLTGVATAGVSRQTLVLTGIILIFVEAFSMGVGSFLSEQSAQEYLRKKDGPIGQTLADGSIMFVSYFISGIIPLWPYYFFEPLTAIWVSMGSSLMSLFLLGFFAGKLFAIDGLKNGAKMVTLGGLAIAVGIAVGQIVHI